MVIREDRGQAAAEAVIFVHGAGVAGWMWKKQLEDLAPLGLRLLVVDLPDHGRDRQRPFAGIETVADEIAQLVREAIPSGRAHLVGHSLGAKLVLEVVARHPGLVSSAVVSSALVRPSRMARMMDSHPLNKFSLRMLRNAAMARLQAAQFAFPDPDMTEAFLADIAAMGVENLDRPVAAFCARLFPPPGLADSAVPVLLTAGSRELRSMLGSMEDLFRLIPDARTAVIEGARHNYPWTHHEAYSALLETWLKEKAGRG